MVHVMLRCHRDGRTPGDVLDLPADEAAPLLDVGAAVVVEATPAPDAPLVPAAPETEPQSDVEPEGRQQQ